MERFSKVKMTFVDKCVLASYRLFSTLSKRTKFSCISAVTAPMDSRHEVKSTMAIVNIPPIVSTYRHAIKTFTDTSNFTTNLSQLKSMMDALKEEDFGFDKTLTNLETWKKPKKAPCTYIEVFENSQINMSIFVLKPGFKMPLHDHPDMYGLLKVISGAVKIRSFSEHPLTEHVNTVEFEKHAKQEASRLQKGIHDRRRFFAKISHNGICRANSETCILTPTVSNYHEIEALEMPAAFFDILAPPYMTVSESVGKRLCRYYYVANEISSNLVELQETEVPECFYCDQAPYLGPILS